MLLSQRFQACISSGQWVGLRCQSATLWADMQKISNKSSVRTKCAEIITSDKSGETDILFCSGKSLSPQAEQEKKRLRLNHNIYKLVN